MDRRRESRHQVILRVDHETEGALLTDYASDIASGGIFVRTDVVLAVGAPVRLTLSFPGLLNSIDVDATVKWRRSVSDAGAGSEGAGFGVSFDPGQEDKLAPIRHLVARLSTESLAASGSRAVLEVLLVEDNRFVQDLFLHALRRIQPGARQDALRVHTSFTGHEALRLLPDFSPRLAIIDHFLPGMTGAELVRRIRAQPRFVSLPILVVSTGGRDSRAEALESGATVYLDKPVLLTQLVSTIRAMLTEPVE